MHVLLYFELKILTYDNIFNYFCLKKAPKVIDYENINSRR